LIRITRCKEDEQIPFEAPIKSIFTFGWNFLSSPQMFSERCADRIGLREFIPVFCASESQPWIIAG
jgi:hypothetical protein